MKSNRFHIILKIFGFLIISIGILFICQFFTKTLEEGFATQAQNITAAGCSLVADSGRNLILCPDSNAAFSLQGDLATNLPNEYDNICITNGRFSSNYYTCYTRPAAPVYNDTYGVYRDFDPTIDDDTAPFDLAPSIDSFCTSYDTNSAKVIRGLHSTIEIYGRLTSAVLTTNTNIARLNFLKQQYCNPVIPGMEDECSQLSASYQTISALPASQGLNAATAATSIALNSLSNLSTQIFAEYGSNCNKLPMYALSNI
jgi:hypothetical protein